ncbi:hypothetical protein JTE90_028885 [Oedothorax gibbosus]|uniref:NADP-dependent oxidoreductase domain-containing protein n=1 Tax=Oedothorax gibbosus TaxID=931172 RepID=A0AAV6URH6_9ARAC|nr:hypothetical protein JTE90_028885 [Oedothorax gibbosus]
MVSKEDFLLLSDGHRLPLVGLGTWQIDDQESVERALELAIDAGYRHFDTAFAYENEQFIGSALKRIFQSGRIKREDIFITTKLPMNGMRPENVEFFFKLSLEALQLEYVDLYLLHFPVPTKRTEDIHEILPLENGELAVDTDVNLLETWKAMEKLVEGKLVKSIGISNFNSEQIRRIYNAATIKPTALQVECHPFLQQIELLEFAKSLKIAFIAYSPLGTPGMPNFIKKKYGVDVTPDSLLEDERIKKIAVKHNKTAGQILLRFQVQQGIAIIPKSSNPTRIKENIQIFDFELDEEDLKTIKSMNKNHRYFDFVTHKR